MTKDEKLITEYSMKKSYVYIMSSLSKTIYIGVTNDLKRRVFEHKNPSENCFTKRYHVNLLVYYQRFSDIKKAIAREKQLKGWSRFRKIKLVESVNPGWNDLSKDL